MIKQYLSVVVVIELYHKSGAGNNPLGKMKMEILRL